MEIDSHNAREEIKDILEKCTKCGLCKSLCPVFRIVREEQYSPRGMAIMMQNDIIERILYDCTLCKACEIQCPMNLKICDSIIKARNVFVNSKREVRSNNEIIKNLNKTGNIFGIKEDSK